MTSDSSTPVTVAAFYKFVALDDCREWQPRLLAFCRERGLKGTILLAGEGLNGTVAGTRGAIEALFAYLRGDPRLADLEYKASSAEAPPFLRMKVKLKKEIVTLGVPGVNPAERVGRYVDPARWNELIRDPEVLLIDTRNDYEYGIGTFKGAVNPKTESFREFSDYVERELDPKKHRKVAMFCTGGIRCEKATSYLLSRGFDEVYHLKGGILKYLEETRPAESLWKGECFVFDDRVAVDHGLAEGSYDQCHACRHPVSEDDKRSPEYRPGVSCPRCYGRRTAGQTASAAERYRQERLARARGERHLGADMQRPKRKKVADA